MQKTTHRGRRRHGSALRSRRQRRDSAGRPDRIPAQQDTRDSRSLLDRLLDTPHLAQVIPQLQPEVLHRVIQSCGLEDCGELVALATPDQLVGVFDFDLWRSERPGVDEQFDAGRFGLWLEVLVESGASVAARKVAGMDGDLVTTALAQHLRVFDSAAGVRIPDDGLVCEMGGYLVASRRTDSWDAIVAVLLALDAEHHDCFHRVMHGCRPLSSSSPEIDGLDDLLTTGDQEMFDLAIDREHRREAQGYVTPAQARAFLMMSRHRRLGEAAAPPRNPVAVAYFRGLDWTASSDSGTGRLPTGPAPAPPDSAAAVAVVVNVLLEAGVLSPQPRALLDGPRDQARRLALIQTCLQWTRDCDHAAYSLRSGELAYLANAIVAGCSIQARPFSVQEASDAAVAVCNLGLENWPRHWLSAAPGRGSTTVDAAAALPDDFLVGHDLVSVFQVGWTVLHADVCMDTAERLIEVLTRVRPDDDETQAGVDALRLEMAKHWQAGTPWRAREALDVIAILDLPAWATLLGLIAECPVMHAGIEVPRNARIRSVSASAFEFISENRQIAAVHDFMRSLPDTLCR
jgi:hypothetical protein